MKKPLQEDTASTKDARYHKSNQLIFQALNQALAERRINLRSSDLCRSATITYPTFHAHFASPDAALRQHELDLRQEFQERLPASISTHTVAFTILLSFVYDQRDYFGATLPTANHWLLTTLFGTLRPHLAGGQVANRTYDIYIQTQIGIISCWAKYEDLAPATFRIMSTRCAPPACSTFRRAIMIEKLPNKLEVVFYARYYLSALSEGF